MKFAIVCASGIGDGLLMQIAAHHLRRLGHETVTCSPPLMGLREWFPGFAIEAVVEPLDRFEQIILQHDNTPKAKQIAAAPNVYRFYGSHKIEKHGPLRDQDLVFNQYVPMAENIRRGMKILFPSIEPTLDNGIQPKPGFSFRKFPKRVAIHPTSTAEGKNWPKQSYWMLYERLKEKGWDPVFITSPDQGTPLLPLGELAGFLYESGFFIGNDSGPGHLASNLRIPTLTIGPTREHLAFWRPGWAPSKIVFAPHWIKKMGWNWKRFVSVNNVYKEFIKLTELNYAIM